MASSESGRVHQGEYSGEPGCKTLNEIGHMFQHYWDPTAYWECEAQGKPARLKHCDPSQLFSSQKAKCVHYAEWDWAEPKEPPTRPTTK